MKAYAHSLRIAPKKANLVAMMIRGMPVPEALEALRRTHKKSARMIETLLLSAVANAEHNDRQEAQSLVIRSIIVNQGTSYRRGVPMARGRIRPMRKFLSHISVTLGVRGVENEEMKTKKRTKTIEKVEKKQNHASRSNATMVQKKENSPVKQSKTKKEKSSESSSSTSSHSS